MKSSYSIPVFLVCFFLVLLLGVRPGEAQFGPGNSEIQQGIDLAPVPLDLRGKNPALVARGSYIVNAQGACVDCHTFPWFVDGGDPFSGEPEQVNATRYLAGGVPFGPFISRNLTPDGDGLPAGYTLEEFIHVLRTGEDLKALPPIVADPDGIDLLQVMPWPVYKGMTDRDLMAVYEYLRSIPCVEPDPEVPVPGSEAGRCDP